MLKGEDLENTRLLVFNFEEIGVAYRLHIWTFPLTFFSSHLYGRQFVTRSMQPYLMNRTC